MLLRAVLRSAAQKKARQAGNTFMQTQCSHRWRMRLEKSAVRGR